MRLSGKAERILCFSISSYSDNLSAFKPFCYQWVSSNSIGSDLHYRWIGSRRKAAEETIPRLIGSIANQIWRYPRVCDLEILEKMRRRFVKKVQFRCNVAKGSLKLPTISDRLGEEAVIWDTA